VHLAEPVELPDEAGDDDEGGGGGGGGFGAKRRRPEGGGSGGILWRTWDGSDIGQIGCGKATIPRCKTKQAIPSVVVSQVSLYRFV
jgi:hypothetical protein